MCLRLREDKSFREGQDRTQKELLYFDFVPSLAQRCSKTNRTSPTLHTASEELAMSAERNLG